MFEVNPILACDFYKVGHKFQYPEGTEFVYSNLTARSNRLAPMFNNKRIDKIVIAAVQGFVKSFLIDSFNKNFFQLSVDEVIAEYDRRTNTSLGEGSVDSSHIRALHNLGYLPLHIKALPEGSLVDMKIPFLTVVNTHPDFFWLTNKIESVMSTELWPAITSASIAFSYRKLLQEYAVKTGSPLDFVLWQGHDFSMRGLEGVEAGAKIGLGHLMSFLGTDTIPAIEFVEKYYQGLNTFVGGSVPATEHSVMCAGGSDDEVETIRRIIQDVYPSGVISVVSDTWDYWDTITAKAKILKPVIMNRKPNALGLAKVVFRPDSGDPVKVLCGYKIADLDADPELFNRDRSEFAESEYEVIKQNGKYYFFDLDREYGYGGESWIVGLIDQNELSEAKAKGSVETLWEIFGGTITSTGHKLLDSHVGLIYGDSITLDRAYQILSQLEDKGFASANVVFGIGSFTYQYQTRDTFGMAMKATWAQINGKAVELFKDPKTDSGFKKSARGLLRVMKEGCTYVLYESQNKIEEAMGELRTVFLNGVLTVDESIDTIRARIEANLKE